MSNELSITYLVIARLSSPWPHRAHLVCELGDQLGEASSLRGGGPVHEKPLSLDANVFQEIVHQGVSVSGVVVAFQIVTVAGVTTQDHDTISTVRERFRVSPFQYDADEILKEAST